MLVCINGSFKTPVAHYLINSLTGKEKTILLKDLLIKLSQSDIEVLSITFDGDKTHARACEVLGANFNYEDKSNFKPYFGHPSTLKSVYVFLDPCHMLKLVRNYFALKGPIIYDKKETISWEYIKKLNNIQIHEGLHCACKIRDRHIYFHNEKMKVSLAAQVLSSSVSTALHFLEYEIKNYKFEKASSTAKFCKIMNDIFDLLNVRNKFCKTPGRKGITKDLLSELKTKIDEYIDYIEKLEIDTPVKIKKNVKITEKENSAVNNNQVINKIVRKSVLECESVKTEFLGFIICLKNLFSLSTDLIQNNIVKFVLSYKLSQDHVEMFFALIRRMNGFNNNPTTVQYQSAYTKLVANNLNVLVPASANCIPQDNTLIISDETNIAGIKQTIQSNKNTSISETNKETRNKKRKRISQQKRISNFPVYDYFKNNDNNNSIFDHNNYCENARWYVSDYLEEIVKHIAGSIVYSVKKNIICKICRDMLEGDDTVKSKLTIKKNRGDLHFPSEDVIFICMSTEKTIRRHVHLLLTKDINNKLITERLQTLPNTILDSNNHILDQDPLYDHRHQLILLIIQKYIDIRLTHESKCSKDDSKRIRMRNNKLTIFSGQ